MSAKLSFVIPVYNAAAFLENCIGSLLVQDCPDWEAVFVDDGSTDAGAEMIASAGDSRIRLIRQENAGPAAARMKGVSHVDGDYIVFLDADDRVRSDAVRLLLSAPPSDVLCFQAWKEREGKPDRLLTDRHIASPEAFADAVLSRRTLGCLWNKRFTRHLFDGNLFCPRGGYGEDRIMLVQLVEASSSDIAFLDIPLYYYRKARPGSLTRVGRHSRKCAEGRNYMDFYRATGKRKYLRIAVRLLLFRSPGYLFGKL